MARTTRATIALDRAGVSYSVHSYGYDPDAERIGLHAAESLGVSPERVLKTLMAEVDGKPVCVVVPSNGEISMKRLAAACAGKSAQMMRPSDAERLTGYHVGGMSPFGQKKQFRTLIEITALEHESVFINGGQRGLQIYLKPIDAKEALRAEAASIMV